MSATERRWLAPSWLAAPPQGRAGPAAAPLRGLSFIGALIGLNSDEVHLLFLGLFVLHHHDFGTKMASLNPMALKKGAREKQ